MKHLKNFNESNIDLVSEKRLWREQARVNNRNKSNNALKKKIELLIKHKDKAESILDSNETSMSDAYLYDEFCEWSIDNIDSILKQILSGDETIISGRPYSTDEYIDFIEKYYNILDKSLTIEPMIQELIDDSHGLLYIEDPDNDDYIILGISMKYNDEGLLDLDNFCDLVEQIKHIKSRIEINISDIDMGNEVFRLKIKVS